MLRFSEFIPLHWTEKQIYVSEMSPVFLCEATIQHTGMFELFPYLYLLTAWPQIHVSTLGNCFVEDQISSMVLIRSLLNYTNILVFPCVRANGRTCWILLNVQLRHILPFFIGFIETHDGQLACVSSAVCGKNGFQLHCSIFKCHNRTEVFKRKVRLSYNKDMTALEWLLEKSFNLSVKTLQTLKLF